jgi:hypothetical protein
MSVAKLLRDLQRVRATLPTQPAAEARLAEMYAAQQQLDGWLQGLGLTASEADEEGLMPPGGTYGLILLRGYADAERFVREWKRKRFRGAQTHGVEQSPAAAAPVPSHDRTAPPAEPPDPAPPAAWWESDPVPGPAAASADDHADRAAAAKLPEMPTPAAGLDGRGPGIEAPAGRGQPTSSAEGLTAQLAETEPPEQALDPRAAEAWVLRCSLCRRLGRPGNRAGDICGVVRTPPRTDYPTCTGKLQLAPPLPGQQE